MLCKPFYVKDISMNGSNRSTIKPGVHVQVVQKQDQSSGKLTEGIVKDILTKSSQHPHGIKVRLQSGIVGRVQKILDDWMRIYVDADGFPSVAKDLLIRAVIRVQVPLIFVANKPLRYEPSAVISSIIVPEGPDVTDDRIVERVEPGDLVITADIPLADRVVAKGAFALNYRGKLYTEDNIKDRLAMRDLMNELRDGGMMTGGPAAFGKKDCQAFINQLDSFLSRQLKIR